MSWRKQVHSKDSNQDEIVAFLERRGCSVLSIAMIGSGVPDILVGYGGQNFLIEIKGGRFPSERHLSDRQKKWHEEWAGQVKLARSKYEAWKIVREGYRRWRNLIEI